MSENRNEIVISPLNPFTNKQKQVLKEIANGTTSYEAIAQNLKIKRNTVKNHVAKIFERVTKITGEKVYSQTDLLDRLQNDIMFLKKLIPEEKVED